MNISHKSYLDINHILAGGGEMGALIRAKDWSQTTLGPIEKWPQSLYTSLSLLLASSYPMYIGWGSEYVVFYNDAYRPILGATKHPGSLGRPTREVWHEIWDLVGPWFDEVMAGRSIWREDQLYVMERHGFPEECYFTFSYSPIRAENGAVGGVFVTVIETTERVISTRRMETLRDLSVNTNEAHGVEEAYAAAARVLSANPLDFPFSLLYSVDEAHERATLVASVGVEAGLAASPTLIDLSVDLPSAWPLHEVFKTCRPTLTTDLDTCFGILPHPSWPYPPHSAFTLPILAPTQAQPIGMLVVGLSAGLKFDRAYQDFLEMVVGYLATAVTKARAYEEERRRAEMLEELNQAKTVFFSNVSHELRTPLTLMLGPLEDLLQQELHPEQHQTLAIMHRNALRLLKLVNTLLDFSRLEAGRSQPVFEPTDLARLTTDVASVFRSGIERAGLAFTVDCPPLGESLYVDREMWEKIVLNLLSNAFKFTFAGGISISLRLVGETSELRVKDTGIGIPAEELPRIFERFHQVRDTRARSYEGTGIGLSLVHELVTLHGGTVKVESVEGMGTTFIVSIPTGIAHLPPAQIQAERLLTSTATKASAYVEEAQGWLIDAPNAAERQLESHGEGQPSPEMPPGRILVVDDNADMRDYTRRLLNRHWTVATAPNGQAALDAIDQYLPDLVLTDVMMPGISGFELLRELRDRPETATIPVILLSARAGEEASLEGFEAGANDYLTKPFSARQLIARVRTQLTLVQTQRAMQQEIERRKQIEQDLRAKQDELTDFVENAAVPLHWVAEDGTILWANQAELDLLGYARDEYIGHRIAEFYVDPPVAKDVMKRLSRSETLHDYEARVRASDGTIKHVLISSNAYRLDGRFVHTRCFTRDITARREAEMMIRRLAAVVESSHDAIYSKDLDGIITSWNASAEQMYGYTAEEAVGKPITLLIPEEYSADLDHILERMRRGERIDYFETVRVAKDGRRIETSLTLSPMRSPAGEIIGISSIARDITERIRLAREIENSERRLRALFDHAHDPILLADDSARYVDVNPAASRLLGYSRDELLQMSVMDLTPDVDRNLGQQMWQAFIEQGGQQGEYELQRKDERSVTVEYRAVANIVPGLHLSILHDVTERRRAEQMLADAFAHTDELYQITRQIGVADTTEMVLSALAASSYFRESIGLGIFWFNRPWIDVEPEYGDILASYSANPALPDFTGLRFQFQNYALKSFSAPDRAVYIRDTNGADFTAASRELLKSIGSRSFITIPLIAQGLCRGYLYAHWGESQAGTDEDIRFMQQLADQAASTLYHILLLQSENEARKAAEQAVEMKSRFLAMISHELRTPLTSLKGFATTLLATDVRFSEADQRDFIEIISDEADKLQNLIEQLLDLTRMQAGSFSVHPEPIAVTVVLDSAMAQLHSLCANHILEISVPKRLPRVSADKLRVGQVLTNLVHNACKFSPSGSPVTITAARQDLLIRVDVTDQGSGIPAAERETIFEPFRQIEDVMLERGTSGVGLGLAIARGIVEAHGGHIWVQDRETPGTTMSFTLPIAPAHWQERFVD